VQQSFEPDVAAAALGTDALGTDGRAYAAELRAARATTTPTATTAPNSSASANQCRREPRAPCGSALGEDRAAPGTRSDSLGAGVGPISAGELASTRGGDGCVVAGSGGGVERNDEGRSAGCVSVIRGIVGGVIDRGSKGGCEGRVWSSGGGGVVVA